jgi:hypothetical protein
LRDHPILSGTLTLLAELGGRRLRHRLYSRAGNPGGLFYASAGFAQRLKVRFQQFHDERLIAWTPPAIALKAADQKFAVVVDFGERAMAVGAFHAAIRAPSPLRGGASCFLPDATLASALAERLFAKRRPGVATRRGWMAEGIRKLVARTWRCRIWGGLLHFATG